MVSCCIRCVRVRLGISPVLASVSMVGVERVCERVKPLLLCVLASLEHCMFCASCTVALQYSCHRMLSISSAGRTGSVGSHLMLVLVADGKFC